MPIRCRGKIIFIALAIFFLSGFAKEPEIRDLKEIPQDHRIYTERQAQGFNNLDAKLQIKSDAFFNEVYFSPWHIKKSRYNLDDVKWEFDKYGKYPGYGRKGERHPGAWIKKLIANADLEVYSRGVFTAITLRNSDLRVLPTLDAHLSYPGSAALPFDNMQNSGIAGNTPVFVSHLSKDKKWVLAESYYAIGWIPAEHIAPVDAAFIKQWERGDYAAVIKDKTPIYDDRGSVLFKAPLGLFFPKAGEDGKSIQILIAVADKQGKAIIKKTDMSKEAVTQKPLKLTAENMALIANRLMNEPYGWGGLYQRRDCSSTLMDLFSPFGIWLPRNSGHQAKRTGTFINLRNLPPEEKEKAILARGIPYFTLIWLKGHIMLYIGKRNSHALVFHNFWNVRTKDAKGRKGRKIVGRAVITTLRPGQELNRGDRAGDILPHVRGMTLLWPPFLGPADFSPLNTKDD